MPLPVGLLIGGGLAAGAGVAQAVAGGRRTEFDRENERRLEELQRRRASGTLGLTADERLLAEREQLTPVQQQASALQSRQEALAAGAGEGVSGATLSRLRQETGRTIGSATQQAATNIQRQDIEARRQQEAELSQREAVAEQRRQARTQSVLGGLSQAAGAAGQVAGAIPETFRLAGVAGAPIRDTASFARALDDLQVGPAARDALLAIPPDRLTTVLANIQEGRIGEEEQVLLDAMTSDRGV